ncbi:MAG: hypothetical protein BWX48_00680 [Verrucomicrobia bacterium ADurb.Bin006]|nr:MAG: hypothetical protein BWX48_00680 [Verrucomicrobia bacterium ADurb.Bin006]
MQNERNSTLTCRRDFQPQIPRSVTQGPANRLSRFLLCRKSLGAGLSFSLPLVIVHRPVIVHEPVRFDPVDRQIWKRIRREGRPCGILERVKEPWPPDLLSQRLRHRSANPNQGKKG